MDNYGRLWTSIGADGGTRTRTPFQITDFKSVASTISPRPHGAAMRKQYIAQMVK